MSAMNALALVMKYAGEFAFTSNIGSIFMFLGKMTISSSVTFSGFLIIEHWPYVYDSLYSPVIPCCVIFIIAYIVGSTFISIYSVASNTILQCFLVDTDISK